MNEPQDAQVWLDAPGAPVAKLENEDPAPVTVNYDELVKSWQE
jgi:glycerol transport system substrate-binding protein